MPKPILQKSYKFITKCMFGFTYIGAKIDSDMFGCSRAKLILPPVFILLEAFDCRIDFNTQIYYSNHFYMNVSNHKPLYLQFIFT